MQGLLITYILGQTAAARSLVWCNIHIQKLDSWNYVSWAIRLMCNVIKHYIKRKNIHVSSGYTLEAPCKHSAGNVKMF